MIECEIMFKNKKTSHWEQVSALYLWMYAHFFFLSRKSHLPKYIPSTFLASIWQSGVIYGCTFVLYEWRGVSDARQSRRIEKVEHTHAHFQSLSGGQINWGVDQNKKITQAQSRRISPLTFASHHTLARSAWNNADLLWCHMYFFIIYWCTSLSTIAGTRQATSLAASMHSSVPVV
jgi:hypothetical protein